MVQNLMDFFIRTRSLDDRTDHMEHQEFQILLSFNPWYIASNSSYCGVKPQPVAWCFSIRENFNPCVIRTYPITLSYLST